VRGPDKHKKADDAKDHPLCHGSHSKNKKEFFVEDVSEHTPSEEGKTQTDLKQLRTIRWLGYQREVKSGTCNESGEI
jgi:hypothetical protein